MGFVAGIPTALIAGLWFGKRISKKIFIAAPEEIEEQNHPELPPIAQTLLIIGLPIVLIY